MVNVGKYTIHGVFGTQYTSGESLPLGWLWFYLPVFTSTRRSNHLTQFTNPGLHRSEENLPVWKVLLFGYIINRKNLCYEVVSCKSISKPFVKMGTFLPTSSRIKMKPSPSLLHLCGGCFFCSRFVAWIYSQDYYIFGIGNPYKLVHFLVHFLVH